MYTCIHVYIYIFVMVFVFVVVHVIDLWLVMSCQKRQGLTNVICLCYFPNVFVFLLVRSSHNVSARAIVFVFVFVGHLSPHH